MGNVAQRVCLTGLLWMTASACGSVSQVTPPAESPAVVTAEPSQEVPIEQPKAGLTDATVIELAALRKDTAGYEWFEFKPGVRKLILSGAPDSRHVSMLWYYESKP